MSFYKSFAIFICMAFAVASAYMLKPEPRIVDPSDMLDYESIIPISFGNWTEYSNGYLSIVDPEMQANLDKIYSQTVTRTYINSQGQSIMLSIAYGPNQSDKLKSHKPEVCYPAQGFVVKQIYKENFETSFVSIPITRLETSQAQRSEFVSYWMLIGNQLIKSGLDRKLKQLEFGLQGFIPDGMLFRVSSVGSSMISEFDTQNDFIISLLNSLTEKQRVAVIGQDQL